MNVAAAPGHSAAASSALSEKVAKWSKNRELWLLAYSQKIADTTRSSARTTLPVPRKGSPSRRAKDRAYQRERELRESLARMESSSYA